jgi:AbrB family looped-hinge helix DNA binding protein
MDKIPAALYLTSKEHYSLLMKSTVSSKGQITLPVEVRTQLGLVAGTPVSFELMADGVLVRKGGGEVHPVDQVYGAIRLGAPVDRLVDDMRGPRPRRRR